MRGSEIDQVEALLRISVGFLSEMGCTSHEYELESRNLKAACQGSATTSSNPV